MDDSTQAAKQWTEWFEIPVSDFDRAQAFYEAIFNTEFQKIDFGPILMGMPAHSNVGFALCKNEFYTPSEHGVLVYLNANPDLQIVADRVLENGGQILVEKKQISPEHGYMCVFLDSEGNRLALHSAE